MKGHDQACRWKHMGIATELDDANGCDCPIISAVRKEERERMVRKGIGVEHHEYRHRTSWWNAHHSERYNDMRLTWRTDEFGINVVDLECRRCDSLLATRVGKKVEVSVAMTLCDIHLKECDGKEER